MSTSNYSNISYVNNIYPKNDYKKYNNQIGPFPDYLAEV